MKLYKFQNISRLGTLSVWVIASNKEKALDILVEQRRQDELPFSRRNDWVLVDDRQLDQPGIVAEVTE